MIEPINPIIKAAKPKDNALNIPSIVLVSEGLFIIAGNSIPKIIAASVIRITIKSFLKFSKEIKYQ